MPRVRMRGGAQVPDRTRIAGSGLHARIIRRNQKFGHEVITRHGFMSIKQCLDTAMKLAGRGAKGADRLVDQLQTEIEFIEISDISNLAIKSERLTRPVVGLINFDETDV